MTREAQLERYGSSPSLRLMALPLAYDDASRGIATISGSFKIYTTGETQASGTPTSAGVTATIRKFSSSGGTAR